jgi:threonine/homoserine/homoserine lactone efflux protein
MITYLKGAFIAFTIALNVGPGLVLLFNACINRGFVAGLNVVLGLHSANGFLILLSYLGVNRFYHLVQDSAIFGVMGGLIVVFFGILMIVRQQPKYYEALLQSDFKGRPNVYSFFLKAFAINITNPVNLIFWLGLLGIVSAQLAIIPSENGLFLSGLFVTVIVIDLLKSYLFTRIGNFFQMHILQRVNRFLGAVLMFIGIFFIVRTII